MQGRWGLDLGVGKMRRRQGVLKKVSFGRASPRPAPSELHCGQVVCGVGRGDLPVRHHYTLPRTLGVALAQCGLEEEAQLALLGQGIKEAAEAALAAVLALEAGLSVEQRGGRQVHTDFLGEHEWSS